MLRRAAGVLGRFALTVVVAFAGALGAFGSVVAALFERDGFGRPRDAEPRMWFIVLMAVGLFMSIAVPAVVTAWWFRRRRLIAAIGACIGAAAALVLVGAS